MGKEVYSEKVGDQVKVYEKAPAKINLSLDVIRKRSDGFHDVEMVMTMVDLADRLDMTELPRDTIIISSQAGYIPLNEKNLAFKAAQLIKETYEVKQGVHIHLDKNIPVSAGLAGGSSDAAATLRGLNRLWQLNIPLGELLQLAARLGSDVPFCLSGGTVLATGRGEILQPIAPPPPCWVILAKLPLNISTADIYRKFHIETMGHTTYTAGVLQAIEEQDFSKLCRSIGNALEQVTIGLHPQIGDLKQSMSKLGAEGVLMSGSGPTVFGLVSKEARLARIYNGLRGFCKEVHIVRLLGHSIAI